MLRIAMVFSVSALLLTAVGCTMCCHPNDTCGPVYDSCGGQNCSVYYRAGSILAGSSEMPMLDETMEPDDVPSYEGNSGPVEEGLVPGSEQIISVTERVVGTDEKTASDSTTEESQGWAARRPTRQIQR